MLASYDPKVAVAEGDQSYQNAEQIDQLLEDCLDELEPPDELLEPGDRVILKPNWALELLEPSGDEGESLEEGWEHKITHPTLIEAAARWAAKQLNGNGSITICDSPWVETPFTQINEIAQLEPIVSRCAADFPGVIFALEDFRAKGGSTPGGDAAGTAQISLGEASEFRGGHPKGRPTHAPKAYHFCRTPMDADVLINLPKLKTHNKVGLTCSLNNLLGLLDDRSPLPIDEVAADEASEDLEEEGSSGRLISWLRRRFAGSRFLMRWLLRSHQALADDDPPENHESWYGNDLFWRLVLDVNKSLYYFNGTGERRQNPLRSLTIVDAIIAGEGNGPLHPDPKPAGLLLAGCQPLAVDCVAAALMGFDWQKIRLLRHAFHTRKFPLANYSPENIRAISEHPPWDQPLPEVTDSLNFHPHDGWWGSIELEQADEAT